MMRQDIINNDDSCERPRDRKAYEAPELTQLGTLEDMTRWEASITVGG